MKKQLLGVGKLNRPQNQTTSSWKNIFYTLIGIMALLFSSNANAQTVAPYTSSTTWLCPAGVFSVQVECWGAGGAGGTPVTAGGIPVTAGGGIPVTAGGTPLTAGGTGGTPVTVGGTPVTVGGTGGIPVTSGGTSLVEFSGVSNGFLFSMTC